MFLTPQEFRQSVADTLKVNVANLGEYWDRLALEGMRSAYKDIRNALIGRGFNAVQVDAWEHGAEYQRDIGLFWVFIRSGVACPIDKELVKLFDRREELTVVPVPLDTGAPQTPAVEPGLISSGKLATTDLDGCPDRWTKDTPL